MRDEIRERVTQNIGRVRNLVSIYDNTQAGRGRGRRGHAKTDVLRAATVLLHASLEDYLRSLAYWKLPLAGPDVLDKIPLKSTAPATKFPLGALCSHRGKTVDDVIKESVNEYLERSNYNNTREVANFLQSIGVDPTRVNSTFPAIDELMGRRHQIVHRADRDETGGRGNYAVRSIGRTKVCEWIDAAESLCNAVLDEVPV
jgi:hypothetical protein